MTIENQLAGHLEQIGSAPFLFVGSGMSRRYIGLEDWEGLLRRFSADLPRPYEYYRAKASGDLPATARELAEAFYELWWNRPEYAESRAAYQEHLTGTASCIKYEISKYLSEKKHQPGLNAQADKELELLKNATVDGVITTNWDTLLESVFPEYEVYVGQEQVLFGASQGIAEIYKVHGCVTEPNSLVLTGEDYDGYNQRNPYLTAKLLTTFVENPIIFLGYSIADDNIRTILKQVASCLTTDRIQQLQGRLIFVQPDMSGKGDSFESSVLQINSYALPMTFIRTNDYAKIYRPLSGLRRRFPARLLRKMKEHIYELVKSNDPKGKLSVVDINEDGHFEDLEVVYGVGVLPRVGQAGYKALSRTDLMKDVLASRTLYNAATIIDETLPELLKQAKYVPVFRYLREGGYISSDGAIDTVKLDERVAKAATAVHEDFYPPQQYRGSMGEVQNDCKTIAGVKVRYGANAFIYLPMLKEGQVAIEELRRYLLENMDLMGNKRNIAATYFRSLICFYDWLAYR